MPAPLVQKQPCLWRPILGRFHLMLLTGSEPSKAVQGLNNSKPIDFIYDPVSKRFIMGRNRFGHDGILDAGKIPSSDAIVGGVIWKENGVIRTYEWSGHYRMNWTPELREQFKSFMRSHGVDVTHTPGISR